MRPQRKVEPRGASDPSPRVSVVVPTRDRPDPLARCLRALERQSVEALEVVVVDDGSRGRAAVAATVAAAPGARLIQGEGAGPAAARNSGARAARAAVVCFTDDDCEPTPDWAEGLARRIEAGTDAVAGPTANGRAGDPFATAYEALVSHLVEASLDPDSGALGFAPTSNLACRAELLAALPFDEAYPLAAGEDRDWCARLTVLGHALRYERSAVVLHYPELSLARFWRQQHRYGQGAYRFRRAHRPPGHPRRRLEPASFYLALVGRGFEHGPVVGALLCLAQVATVAGVGRAALADRARRLRALMRSRARGVPMT